MDFLWHGKRGYSQRALEGEPQSDVSIRKADMEDKIRARFIFRNGANDKISETDYMVYAIYKNKIYFKGADEHTGLKMTANNTKCGNRYVQINREEDAVDIWDFLGDYKLMFDEKKKLYFIQGK